MLRAYLFHLFLNNLKLLKLRLHYGALYQSTYYHEKKTVHSLMTFGNIFKA